MEYIRNILAYKAFILYFIFILYYEYNDNANTSKYDFYKFLLTLYRHF
jgi:hypothetical protein